MNNEHYKPMTHEDWVNHQAEIQRMGRVIVDRQTRLSKIAQIKADLKSYIQRAKKQTSPKDSVNRFERTKSKAEALRVLAAMAKATTVQGV